MNLNAGCGIFLLIISAMVYAQPAVHKVHLCPGVPDNSAYSVCGAAVVCATPTKSTDITRYANGNTQTWTEWQEIPPTGGVCDCTVAGQSCRWVTKSSTRIVVRAASAAATAAMPVAPSNGNSIKFHPGWYLELDPNHNTITTWSNTIASYKGTPNLKGFYLIRPWIWFEPSMNVYTDGSGDSAQGFAALDQLLSVSKANGFQFIVGLDGKAFGKIRPGAGSYGVLPPYFDTLAAADGPPGYLSASTRASGDLLLTIKAYDPAITARYNVLIQAYGQRYDSNPTLEMFRDSTESANGLFSPRQYAQMPAQYIAWAANARKYFPTTGISLTINFMNTAAQIAQIYEGVMPYAVFIGGPDTFAKGINNAYTPGSGKYNGISNIVFNGYIDANGNSSGTDYRGRLGWVTETETPEEIYPGGSGGLAYQGPQNVYNEMFGIADSISPGTVASGGNMQPQYFIFSLNAAWQDKGWADSDIKEFIAAGHPVNATRPSSYH